MSKSEKPLPKPPSTPFGRKKHSGEIESTDPLIADEMAMAAAKGELDTYIRQKLPDNEYSRKLAELMMGMIGMIPSETVDQTPSSEEIRSSSGSSTAGNAPDLSKEQSSVQPPEDVVRAAVRADVEGLTDLLKRERQKRSETTEPESGKNEQTDHIKAPKQAKIEKETIDQLFTIASKNDLSPEWLFFRALKRYVEEYNRTGNL